MSRRLHVGLAVFTGWAVGCSAQVESSSSSGSGGTAASSGGSSGGGASGSSTSTGTWWCEPFLLGGNNGCDCGCGQLDPDCGGAGCVSALCSDAACAFCHDAQGGVVDCGDRPDSSSAATSGTGGSGLPSSSVAASSVGGASSAPTTSSSHASTSAGSTWWCDETFRGTEDGCDCGCGLPDPDCNAAGCVTLPCADPACEYCYDTAGHSAACDGTSTSSSSSGGVVASSSHGTSSSSGGPLPDGGFIDVDEPNGNDTWSQDKRIATVLDFGVPHQGWISFSGDEDFYKFTVPRAGVAHVVVTTASASPVDYRVQVTCPLRNVFGEMVDTNGESGPTRLEKDIHLGADGQTASYYVFVHDDGDSEYDRVEPHTVTVTFQ